MHPELIQVLVLQMFFLISPHVYIDNRKKNIPQDSLCCTPGSTTRSPSWDTIFYDMMFLLFNTNEYICSSLNMDLKHNPSFKACFVLSPIFICFLHLSWISLCNCKICLCVDFQNLVYIENFWQNFSACSSGIHHVVDYIVRDLFNLVLGLRRNSSCSR